MNKLLPFLLTLFFSFQLSAQNYNTLLRLPSTQLNFGTVMVGDKDSILLEIPNNLPSSIRINQIKFYSTLGIFPFSVNRDTLSIANLGSDSIWVYFEPEQNIFHNSEMVIFYTNNAVLWNGREQLLSIDLIGQGRFPNNYYDTTENLSEEALKDALKFRTGLNYNNRGYNSARDFMYMNIDNKRTNGQGALTNTLECVYTGTNITGYTSRTAAQNGTPNFNTEHTFPQGFFSQNDPMRSDIHHLFPTTNSSNSQRGNKPFGTVTNGSASGGGSFYNNSTYEPRNEQKGTTARAMMYFVIRYQDYSNHFSVQQSILRNWHNAYPPDTIEERRNDDIFAVQNNRNPFVDYPQLEKRITNFVANSTAPTIWGLDVLKPSIDFSTLVYGTPDTLIYNLVNTGNRNIIFSNFALSDTSTFSFLANSGVRDTIEPGESIQIEIAALALFTGTIFENLTFNTNIPGNRSSFTIPITANAVTLGVNEKNINEAVKIYPNPIGEAFSIETAINERIQIRIFDSMGRLIEALSLNPNQNLHQIQSSGWNKGIYFLEISSGNSTTIKKLIK